MPIGVGYRLTYPLPVDFIPVVQNMLWNLTKNLVFSELPI